MNQLKGTKWFTDVDCVQTFHQIPMANERSRSLTTFRGPAGGLFRYHFAKMKVGMIDASRTTRSVDCVQTFHQIPMVNEHSKDLTVPRARRWPLSLSLYVDGLDEWSQPMHDHTKKSVNNPRDNSGRIDLSSKARAAFEDLKWNLQPSHCNWIHMVTITYRRYNTHSYWRSLIVSMKRFQIDSAHTPTCIHNTQQHIHTKNAVVHVDIPRIHTHSCTYIHAHVYTFIHKQMLHIYS